MILPCLFRLWLLATCYFQTRSLPLRDVCDMDEPAGFGDKKILREVSECSDKLPSPEHINGSPVTWGRLKRSKFLALFQKNGSSDPSVSR